MAATFIYNGNSLPAMQHMDTDNQSQPRATGYRVWSVSGCSRGLGRNIVTAALARGVKVVAISRRSSDLDYVKDNVNVKLLLLDVSLSQEALDQVVQEAISAFGVIDILINNAGYVLSGPWEQLRYAPNSHMRWQFI